MKNIIFIAPPAAGKGTQAKLVSQEYNISHISTGDLLRDARENNGEYSQIIKETQDSGKLVPDNIVLELLKERIKKDDCKKGYILDGYPRNKNQAESYNNILKELNYDKGIVIFFNIDKERALKRTLSRIICPNCGASYNLLIDGLQPKKENICDKCHHELKIRTDDTEEVFKQRFDTYMNSTKELIKYYTDLGILHTIEVLDKPVDEIFEEVKRVLND